MFIAGLISKAPNGHDGKRRKRGEQESYHRTCEGTDRSSGRRPHRCHLGKYPVRATGAAGQSSAVATCLVSVGRTWRGRRHARDAPL